MWDNFIEFVIEFATAALMLIMFFILLSLFVPEAPFDLGVWWL